MLQSANDKCSFVDICSCTMTQKIFEVRKKWLLNYNYNQLWVGAFYLWPLWPPGWHVSVGTTGPNEFFRNRRPNWRRTNNNSNWGVFFTVYLSDKFSISSAWGLWWSQSCLFLISPFISNSAGSQAGISISACAKRSRLEPPACTLTYHHLSSSCWMFTKTYK